MADLTVDQIKELTSLYEQMTAAVGDTAAMDKLKQKLADLGPVFDRVKASIGSNSGAFSDLRKSVDSVSLKSFLSDIGSIKDKLMDSAASAGFTGERLKSLAFDMAAVGVAASSRFSLSGELVTMGEAAKGASANLEGMLGKMLQLAPEVKGQFPRITAAMEQSFGKVNAAKNMETSLLMNAAAAGNLTSALGGLDSGMTNLSDMSLEFSRMTAEVGTANNLTAGQTANYATQLMNIPGELGKVIDATDGTGTSTRMLDATLKVASGTFQKFEEVMLDVTYMYENWGKSGHEALEFVTKMSSAAQSLKLPMDTMKEYVKGVGKQFKFLGDNTNGAIDIMTRFGPALRNSGLGPTAMTELVGHMTGAVASMDVAQRGFVSGRTGGAGGLQGGYQIAQQMAEGDTVGVMSKVEDTLRSMFGGQVVTLKEASEDARSAAQFTKQVQMLTTGPLKIAGSEGEAFKILESFSTGKMFEPGMGGEKKPEDHLSDAMKQGNEIQSRQQNELVAMNNMIAQVSTGSAIRVYDMTRVKPGTERAARMEKTRKSAGEAALGLNFQEERSKTTGEREANRLWDGTKQVTSDGMEYVESLGHKFLPTAGAKGAEGNKSELFNNATGKMTDGTTPSGGAMPYKMRKDMEAGQTASEGGPGGRRRTGGAKGSENTIVIQVKSDGQYLNREIKVAIDADGKMRQQDEGKVGGY